MADAINKLLPSRVNSLRHDIDSTLSRITSDEAFSDENDNIFLQESSVDVLDIFDSHRELRCKLDDDAMTMALKVQRAM